MKRLLIACVAVMFLTACTAIRNANSPPGELDENGKINPCHSHKRNRQACGNAKFNAPRVHLLQLGDTASLAREKMQNEPDRRSVKMVDGVVSETWMYLVDYDKSIYAVVTFTGGVIAQIETSKR